jgi:hypothetical protein
MATSRRQPEGVHGTGRLFLYGHIMDAAGVRAILQPRSGCENESFRRSII